MNRTAIRLALVATALIVGACAGETDEVTDDATRSADSEQAAQQDAARDDGSETDDSPGEAGSATTPEGSADGDGPPPAGVNGDRPSGDAPAGGGAAGGAASGSGGSGSGGSGSGAPAGGGGSTPRPPAPDAPPPFVQLDPDPSTYDRYVRLARELGGEVANITEATALASVFCSDPAGSSETYLGGQPLSTYPSDLALVRAYCPDKESQF